MPITIQGFEPLYSDGDSCAALIGPVLVFVARGRPNAEQVTLMNEWGDRLQRELPKGAGFIIIVRSDAPIPTERERTYARGCFEAAGKFAASAAMVIEGAGFVAAALRGAATAITLMSRMRYPFKVFGDVGSAAVFVINKLPDDMRIEPSRLIREVAALRREHERGALRSLRMSPTA